MMCAVWHLYAQIARGNQLPEPVPAIVPFG